ncbi:uncharacterized protein F4822DRAFT_54586 [Hypoxylon trugodes]|uniref:uncharacterized protein n=1 Tax=Hypoxylon trugodes TaxID=326681 RepID=UPI0021951A44|nr:uncharacterized protein F4822DRAFT_54586 [Hypoxylon trugodes]KAI1383897.1 hypothetical protein F4822DRAFT_54586 [Hypoxylon trugodes]
MESSGRFFANPTKPLLTIDPNQVLLASLDRITTYNPLVHTCSTGWTFHGFYSDPTSIAYLFYRLSLLFSDLEFKRQALIDWAQAYLDLSIRLQKKPPDPSNCGIANEGLAYMALSAVMMQDASIAQNICDYEKPLNDGPRSKECSNEWLYGRAGYLYFLRLCRTVFKDWRTAAVLDTAIDKTIRRIICVPQPWTWYGKEYFGAAHGTIGTICQIVLSRPFMAPQIRNLLSGLLDEQYESGNFPSSAGSDSDKLVQFCHGGPGFLISLRSLAPHFPELRKKIEGVIKKAADDTWERGLLTKKPCLCHGIASNALALDCDEGEEKFMHFLSFMSTESMEKMDWMRDAGRDDEFVGLYTGEGGRAWAWGVAVKKGDRVCIGYNDI